MTRIALITGASRGLGAALAEALASDHHVIAVARTVGALEELDDRIQAKGGQATLAPMDVSDPGAMQHLCRSIHDRWGGVDLWVHTAIHASALTPAPMIADKDWDKCWQINVEATRRLITYVTPLLQAREGARAVFFEDARGGEKFFGAYGATKAAQMALVRSWQAETVKTGPEVRIETPPAMATAVRARFFPGEDRDKLTSATDAAAAVLARLA